MSALLGEVYTVWVLVEMRNLFALCINEVFQLRGQFVMVYVGKHLGPCTFVQIPYRAKFFAGL